MPSSAGPNTFGEENLVFAYDLGDTANSYRGEPTENILALGGSDTEIERSGTSYPYYSINIDSYIQSRWSSSNNVLTISYEGKRDYVAGGTGGGNDGYPVYYIYFTDWSWAATLGTGAYDWQYVKRTFTMPDPTTKSVRFAIYHMNSGNRGRSYSRKHMLTFGDHATQFVNGTRSATQGLIDLTGNSTIDLTNISFDSNAQMTFDGTNDYVYISDTLLNVDAFTVEAVINITSEGNYNKPIFVVGNQSTTGIWFFKHRSGLGNRLVMHGYDGVNPRIDVDSVNQVPDAVNTHVAVTFDGNAYQLYMNGEPEDAPVVDNKVAASTDNYIGRQGSTYLAGEIPALKIYSRALTAQEIRSNFNAVKSRFGI